MSANNWIQSQELDAQWEDFKVMDRRRFFAILPIVTIIGGGAAARQKLSLPEIRQQLTDLDNVRMAGVSEEVAIEVVEVAKEDPAAAVDMLQDYVQTTPAAVRQEIGNEAFAQLQDRMNEKAKARGFSLPTVHPIEGGFSIREDGVEIQQVETEAEVQQVQDEYFENIANVNKLVVNEAIEHFTERHEADVTTKRKKALTLRDLEKTGQATTESLHQAVAVMHAQRGEAA